MTHRRYTIEQATELLEQYPYYTLPAIYALQGADMRSAQAQRLARRVAISLGDMEAFSRLFGQASEVFDNFYPQEHTPTSGTIDTIDTFLATFGSVDERENEALTKMIFSTTPDYAATLAAEERDSVPTAVSADDPTLSAQDKLINAFILQNHAPVHESKSDKQTNEPVATATAPKESENSSLTESFVRVLVKNHNYSKAIEIISELSLKNPEKSIYFADQMRFLRKLIINENKK